MTVVAVARYSDYSADIDQNMSLYTNVTNDTSSFTSAENLFNYLTSWDHIAFIAEVAIVTIPLLAVALLFIVWIILTVFFGVGG